MLGLWCSVKKYHWGKRGSDSLVARLAKRACKDFLLDEKEPYAELWMGTHPSGPSVVSQEAGNTDIAGTSLQSILSKVPEYAGSIRILDQWGTDLPFLFKVLSVDQPLSIQSHPDKETARKLHAQDPSNYPDNNHKPEMAIAVTSFEALCSFRTREQLVLILSRYPELKDVIGQEIVSCYLQHGGKETLRSCFKSLMKADQERVESAIHSLSQKWTSSSFKAADALDSELRHVFLMVRKHYPQDIGCLCLFFLNYVKLAPGEGIFLGANEPHAYLKGDCIECMAKSDNVIRAGFTPKFKDVEQLCRSLSYETTHPHSLTIRPKASPDGITFHYASHTKEFSVDQIYFNSDGALCRKFVFEAKDGASLLIVVRGKFTVPGLDIRAAAGSVYLIPAMLSITVVSCESELLCFRAFAAA